jgi:hypothetical protein
VRIIRVVNALPKTVVGRHVAGQLVRCGQVRSNCFSFCSVFGFSWSGTRIARKS